MIPEEIVQFFKNDGGHSLLVKGEPGSGKTTFALELLNEFRSMGSVLYISTRVSDSVIINQFPWVTDMLNKGGEKVKKLSRENLNRLEGLIEEGFVKESIRISDDEAIIEVGELLPELEEIYDFVEKNQNRPMICIDSIDGLSQKYGIPSDKILFTLQKDLVESGMANVVFVLEETGTERIDYLGDGIVHLRHSPETGFWHRVMVITKLRGAKIKRPRYLYTLEGGRFRAITYKHFSLDSEEPDMENLTQFVKRHLGQRAINLTISENFPPELVQTMILSIIKESSGKVIVIPPSFYPGDTLMAHAEKFTGKEVLIVGSGTERRELYLEGRDMLVEMSPDIVQYHGGDDVTLIIGVDTIANIYGDLHDLPALIKNLKFNSRIVLFTPEGFKVSSGVDSSSELMMIEDIPVILSNGANAVHTEKDDTLKLNLIPLY